jgi:hypothetical protein
MEEITLAEVVERQRIADKSEQQCPCQDYSNAKYCICDDE